MSMQPAAAAVSDIDLASPIQISIRRIGLVMVGIGVVLVLAHSIAHVTTNGFDKSKGAAEIARLFDMNREASLPTWYSQTLLLAAAVLALVLAHLVRGDARINEEQTEGSGRFDVFMWRLIGVALLLASIDEGSSIHERFDSPMRATVGSGDGVWRVAWVVPYTFLAVVLAAVLFRFWRRLPGRVEVLTAVAAAMYVFGAVALEAIGAPSGSGGLSAQTDAILTLAEETLEMAGASVFIYALAIHLAAVLADRRVPIGVVP